MSAPQQNWAGNVVFEAARFHRPTSTAELQQLVSTSDSVRAVGTGHSFNRIADTTGDLVSVAGLPPEIDIDRARSQVRVGAGVRYGDLGSRLQSAGFALANTGSLPHISIAGATSTGTHGSGNGNRNLSTAVAALELVTADGDLQQLSREVNGQRFNGMALALGALGVITSVTLDIVPTFEVRQDVYDDLPDERLRTDLFGVLAGGYSVSVFSEWRTPRTHQIWRKQLVEIAGTPAVVGRWYGAEPATVPRHPLASMPGEQTTRQLGVPGPWNERLPHFRLEFTPSKGDELQSEYLLPMEDAAAALAALDDINDQVAAVLQVSELRTVAADDLWLSPSYHRDSFCIHFTWIPDQQAVTPVLTAIEERLAPLGVRPHWGKLFNVDAAELASLYERLPDFRRLMLDYDPTGKFRNDWVDRLIVGAD